MSILRGQRDRYKARVGELEGDLATRTAMLSDALARVERLTSDNVRLYEKIRFLQAYGGPGQGQGQGGSGSGSSMAINVNGTAAGAAGASSTSSLLASPSAELRARGTGTGAGESSGGGASASASDDFEAPYRKLYAEGHDPFADFSRREKARGYEKLNTAERITLRSSQVLLSNKYARTILFFYVLVMHLLVFATLWHFSHVSHRDCDPGDVHPAIMISGAAGLQRLIPTSLRHGAAASAGVALGGAGVADAGHLGDMPG